MGCEGQPGVGFGAKYDPDTRNSGLFQVSGSTLELHLIAEFAAYARHNQLGIYNPTGEKVTLFKGRDRAPSVLTLTFAGDSVMIGDAIVAKDFGRTFGFYLENRKAKDPFAWFSEDKRNIDELITHFRVIPDKKGSYYLGLEDLAGGGNLDYNDFVFQAEGATLISTPEPSTSLLLAIGLSGLAASRRRSKRRARVKR